VFAPWRDLLGKSSQRVTGVTPVLRRTLLTPKLGDDPQASAQHLIRSFDIPQLFMKSQKSKPKAVPSQSEAHY